MLRPATPLSILLFVSFVLLLISVISTPIVKGIPIARYEGVNFGVFGWCKDSDGCSKIQVGWNTDQALPASNNPDFSLPSSARNSLSSLLIVHPIAAFMNLVALGLAVAAHLHSPSHSARYLLGLLILLLPTLLITLLAFLVDILLFVPHLQWGGWIVLASTILITASGVVTCAMRRTLVSRKARKKRIAENAEMSGANFYARQAEESQMMPGGSTESKSPMVNGGPGTDVLPAFASYNARRSEERTMNGPSSIDPVSATSPIDNNRFYGGQRSRSNSRPRPEDYGAPLGTARSYEERPPIPAPSRGGHGTPRGRGGYPPRGGMPSRGSFEGRGYPPSAYGPGRGGHPNRGRGGHPGGPTPPGVPPPGVMIPAGAGRRPPPGYGPQSPDGAPGAYGPPQSAGYARPGEPGFEPPSPSNYGSDANVPYGSTHGSRVQSSEGRRQSPYGSRVQSPAGRQSPYGSRAQSPAGARLPQDMPPPMPPIPDQSHFAPTNRAVTGMDPDVMGMVEMQRSQPQRQQSLPRDYIPPRAGWTDGHVPSPRSVIGRQRVNSGGSDYVEDVDPRFAEQPSAPPAEAFNHPEPQPTIPSLLVAGRNPHDPSPESSSSQVHVPRTTSYDDLHPGARSPVDSEASHFTSVSQRPMNPNWQPGHGGEFNNFGPGPGPRPDRGHQQRRQDILFSGNPDFELPGMGPPRARGGFSGGNRGRGGYGGGYGGPRRPPHPSVLENMGDDGRYPAPMPPPGASNAGSMREI